MPSCVAGRPPVCGLYAACAHRQAPVHGRSLHHRGMSGQGRVGEGGRLKVGCGHVGGFPVVDTLRITPTVSHSSPIRPRSVPPQSASTPPPPPMQPEWLQQCGTPLACLSPPLLEPPPSYQPAPADMVVAVHDVSYGRPSWAMPRCSRRHPDATTRAAVFAAALLDGRALKALAGEAEARGGGGRGHHLTCPPT